MMGLVNSVIVKVLRPLKNFNVENRAQKIISKEKSTPAPRYEVDKKSLDNILKEHPEIVEEYSTKHIDLDNRLKQVYVSSTDVQPIDPIKAFPDRPLPLNRKQVERFEYGQKEPEVLAEGKVTLRQALQFIDDHHTNENVHTLDRITADYKLDKNDVENILKYYHSFELFVPDRLKGDTKQLSWSQKLLPKKKV